MSQKGWKKKYEVTGAHMELTEHLDELRDRIILSVASLFLGVILVGLPFNGPVLKILERPIREVPEWDLTPLEVQVDNAGNLTIPAAALASMKEAAEPADSPPPTPGANSTVSSVSGDDANTSTVTPTKSGIHPSRIEFKFADGSTYNWGPNFGGQLFFFDPVEPFIIRIKLAIILGFVAALPLILLQVWRFIAPGLTPSERKFTRQLLVAGAFFFPMGAVFAYFLMEYALYFLFQYGADFMPAIGAKLYMNFLMTLMVVLGVVFECPLVLLLLIRLGIVSPETLAANRPYVLIGIMVLSAILTPPDPMTMLAVGIPLWVLFELSLMLAKLRIFAPGTDRQENTEAPA